MPKRKVKDGPTIAEASAREGQMDPAEEKMLDKILMGVVIFVLGWLAVGVLMAVGGLFGIWK